MPEQEVETVDGVENEVEKEVTAEVPVTFSQEDFDKELEKRVNEQVATLELNARTEAERLSKLTDDELQAEKVKSLEQEIAELKAERNKNALEKSVTDVLVSNDLPVGLVDSLVKIGDADTIKSVVDELAQTVADKIEAGVQEKIKQPTPQTKATLPDGGGVTNFFDDLDSAAKAGRQ